MKHKITPVILAGGAGTRLRPLTSETRPKPFLKLGKYSLLQHTVMRVREFSPPIVVAAKEYAGRVLDSLSAVDIHPGCIVQEPVMLSTAPALALVSMGLEVDDVMLVMPSDHNIADECAFLDAVSAAVALAQESDIPVLMGVKPRGGSSRYGYIECKESEANNCFYKVLRFIEKPDRDAAGALLARDYVFWNTGIFAVRVGVFHNLLKTHAPDVFSAANEAHIGATQSGVFYEPDFFAFVKAPALAIDVAVMEKLEHAALIPLHTMWSDLGCWPSFIKAWLRHLFR